MKAIKESQLLKTYKNILYFSGTVSDADNPAVNIYLWSEIDKTR